MTDYVVQLDRMDDLYVNGWNVYAKKNDYPTEDGDGTFIGYVTIEPYETDATLEWSSPSEGLWLFGATTVYNGEPGIFRRIDGV